MQFFVDSGIWIAAFNKKDRHHRAASKIIRHLLDEQIDNIYF